MLKIEVSWPSSGGTWVPIGELALPSRFTATVREPEREVRLAIEVDDDAQPTCRAVTVRGDDLNGASVRVPVKQWLDEAMQLAAFKIEPPTQLTQPPSDPRFEEPDFFPVIPTDEQFSRFQEEFAEKARRPRRGSPLTDENLQVTATVYREALERGIPPTEHVAKVSHVTRSTAAKWVQAARRRGFLGAAMPGRGGERKEKS